MTRRPITPSKVTPGPPSGSTPSWPPLGPGPSGSSGPPPPGPPPVHVHVTIPAGGPPDPARPDRWWTRIRWGYHGALLLAAVPASQPWAHVLASVRDDASFQGAWVMAVIPLAITAWWDNAARIQARYTDPDLWTPRIRATIARFALYAATIATARTLPIITVVYAMTGVRS